MFSRVMNISLTAVLMLLVGTFAVSAQDYNNEYEREHDDSYHYERANVDRYLDVEVWTDHSDAEYYVNDDIVVYFRASRDAFVSIYSIDSRGLVSLMFPFDPTHDNFVRGGVTYSIPSPDDDFDLIVSGPEGMENLQIIASRERFPIPNWYNNSGIICETDDRNDYMDWLNGRYFVRYDGQRFAYDRAVIFIDEWEPTYFRPVYYPHYPSWAVVGNVYVDYLWGSSVYINGVYWGCTPLYIPRCLVGWHTMTIYDRWGYGWESDFHCSRYNTVVFDHTVIRPSAQTQSKYKDVRHVGWRDPVNSGYAKYHDNVVVKKAIRTGLASSPSKVTSDVRARVKSITTDDFKAGSQKFVRGSTKMVKTDRGYESRSVTSAETKSRKSTSSKYQNSRKSGSSSSYTKSRSSSTQGSSGSKGKSSSSYSGSSSGKSSSSKSSTKSSDYYQKKSGSSSSKTSKSAPKSSSVKKQSSKSSTEKSSVTTKSPSSSSKKSSSVKSNSTKSSSSKASTSSSKSSSSKSSSSKSSSSKKKK